MEHNLPSVAWRWPWAVIISSRNLVMTKDDRSSCSMILLSIGSPCGRAFSGQKSAGWESFMPLTYPGRDQTTASERAYQTGGGSRQQHQPAIGRSHFKESWTDQGSGKTCAGYWDLSRDQATLAASQGGQGYFSGRPQDPARNMGSQAKKTRSISSALTRMNSSAFIDELMPPMQMGLKLIQLIDDNNGNETKSLQWGEWVQL